jgi:predicted RNA methylase
MNKQEELIRITSEFLDDHLDYYKLQNAAKEYKTLLNELSDQDFDNENGRNDIHFDNGKALGTLWAALCIDDIIRTRQFMRGVDKAIKEKLSNNASLHILYAGTGPFATLLLPFILRYTNKQIKYTLLEINPLSFNALQKVFSKLGLENKNIHLVNEDATKYQIVGQLPDIIISETMQNALAKEQQVPIYLNLMEQSKEDTLFIPEKIKISIGLKKEEISIEELEEKHYHKVEEVFELSNETLIYTRQTESKTTEEIVFPKVKTILQKESVIGFNQIVFITEIDVYKDVKIKINESGLTTPIIIENISDAFTNTITINTQYKIGLEPKLVYDITSN